MKNILKQFYHKNFPGIGKVKENGAEIFAREKINLMTPIRSTPRH